MPSLVLSYVVTQAYSGDGLGADLDVLGAFLATTALGGAAYGAFFLFLSVAIRKPLAVGLLFGFVWESIVEMEEGCRLTSQIIDVDPAAVKIGMQVEAAFRKLGSEGEAGVIHYGYKFRPAA